MSVLATEPRTRISSIPPALVELSADHPGFSDPIYRMRRNAIAYKALKFREGEPVPNIEYNEGEHAVWRAVRERLLPLHEAVACRDYLECLALVDLPLDRIPQLSEVNERLKKTSLFQMHPVGGLVAARDFLGRLSEHVFPSTQYVRHRGQPLFTPEPDVIHELIGHAAQLAHPKFSVINREFGEASVYADEATLERISRVYWFTVEMGVVHEDGKLKAYGAALTSSVDEMSKFHEKTLIPLDLEEVSETEFEVTSYQHKLFVASSFDSMIYGVSEWLRAVTANPTRY
ncbi:MAG: phenylalanine 4-monooxygenase [Polyangiaceae bacterium]